MVQFYHVPDRGRDGVDRSNRFSIMYNITDFLTVYIKNTTASARNCTFASGSPNTVRMPADSAGINTSPQIAPYKTNVYTFVAINSGIFTSYVTGYNYQ